MLDLRCRRNVNTIFADSHYQGVCSKEWMQQHKENLNLGAQHMYGLRYGAVSSPSDNSMRFTFRPWPNSNSLGSI